MKNVQKYLEKLTMFFLTKIVKLYEQKKHLKPQKILSIYVQTKNKCKQKIHIKSLKLFLLLDFCFYKNDLENSTKYLEDKIYKSFLQKSNLKKISKYKKSTKLHFLVAKILHYREYCF